MKNNKIYLDTSVISALFDQRTPERRAMTVTAWETFSAYEVYISEIVLAELNSTSGALKENMLNSISSFHVLRVTDEAHRLASEYILQTIFPQKYYDDALHVALASTNQIPILLSWNFTHLVKLKTRQMIKLVNTMNHYIAVEIISPPEL